MKKNTWYTSISIVLLIVVIFAGMASGVHATEAGSAPSGSLYPQSGHFTVQDGSAESKARFWNIPSAMVVDREGNVYIGGSSEPLGAYSSFLVVKYSASGKFLWARKYGGAGDWYDHIVSMALDNRNNLYVVGYVYPKGRLLPILALIKYDTNGRRMWARKYYRGKGWKTTGEGIALDRLGNIFVVGSCFRNQRGSLLGIYDMVTIKYDSRGMRHWVRIDEESGSSGGGGGPVIVTDGNGNAYVCGMNTKLEEGKMHGCGYCTRKIDSTGYLQWARTIYVDRAHAISGLTSISMDGEGNIYVAGEAEMSSDPYGLTTHTTVKYNSNGDQLWIGQRKSITWDDSATQHIVRHDPYGNVYTTYGKLIWIDETPSGKDVTLKYNQNGELLWHRSGMYEEGLQSYPFDMTVDQRGNVYVTGCGTAAVDEGKYAIVSTVKYDSDGNLLWKKDYGTKEFVSYGKCIKSDRKGHIYVAALADSADGANCAFVILKYDADGKELWARRFDR